MKKIIATLLFVTMMAAVVQPVSANFEQGDGSVGEGYIVQLSQSPQSSDTMRLMSNVELEEVYGEKGLYKVKELSDIENLGDLVEYYEEDQTVTLFAPNDPYAYRQWPLESLGIEYAWDEGFEGEGISIAIIDSGVNSLHEDFEGVSFGRGKNMINGSYDLRDESGHGSFVAGVIAAARDNGVGIAGLLSEVTIVPFKCFGSSKDTSSSYIISAIYEAVDIYGCEVINLSLGMDSDMRSMRQAVDHAVAMGTIIVSSVGNDGNGVKKYPAAYDNVIGVGAIDEKNKVASFSQKNDSVFIVAPGKNIISIGHSSYNSYVMGDGTSYSSPHVAVAAAIMKQYEPKATIEDFSELLIRSSLDLGKAGYDTSYGHGSLDISQFIEELYDYDFAEIEDTFPDVKGHWASEVIEFCVSKKLFNGVSQNQFAPELSMNRAMFVTVLSRMSGEDISGFVSGFQDVPEGTWYSQPVGWGAAAKIINGFDENNFNPEGKVTREQMALLLYRYANAYELMEKSLPPEGLDRFSDKDKVSDWAYEAMCWAVGNGLITGRGGGVLAPQEGAKRSEVAAIISRFYGGFLG
ncbi:MAG: S8 family serine peptidase, partial [Clostridiales bacterium]|nr:S8 family serine peptidase [Clostridiales bacterium]